MNAREKSVKAMDGNNQTLLPIAVIGMAGILPDADNLTRYWQNIINEVNCIREVPPSRWATDEYYDPDPSIPDKSYSKHGGFIPDIPFDPMEFGLPPNILEVTDVSQLLSLVVARRALADAGYADGEEGALDRTGVILGMVGMSSKVIHPLLNRLQYPIWEKVLRASAIPENEIPAIIEKMKLAYVAWNENAFPGAIGNVVAGRIANRLDLGGTNCIVDAACGSSLAAASMAISELVMGRADMMITGGVDTDNSILTYLCFSKTPAFSKGDRLRAFSAESDGMLVGEGIGMLVLKRLSDAERDGDRIYAVIRGVGTSSDGHFKSIYAPRSSGQAKALRRAYENSGFAPDTIGLIEAHGTGTIAGDPAEFEGLRQVFCENDPEKQHIALGSVKSQIGHTKATAGAASLIKASLALHHKVLPATINVSKPHPDMDIENTPFYLNTQTRPWFKNRKGLPRRAGVSSFGFGGTNFHITLEEYQADQKDAYRLQPVPYSVLLSANNPEELIQTCQETLTDLESEDKQATLNRLDRAAGQSIPQEHARLGFVAVTTEEAGAKLREAIKMLKSNPKQESWSHPRGIFYRKTGLDPQGKTVALFPGQGSQYVEMGRELAVNFPPFRRAFEEADEIIGADGRHALTSLVYPIPVFSDEERKKQAEQLTRTENAQPAIGTFSLALYKMLQAAGFQADFFAGHSFGELSALWAAGVYDDKAFLRLAKARGEAMSTPAASGKDAGGMVAVKGDVEKVQEILKENKDVSIANFNSPTQVVLAGATPAIAAIRPELEKAGLKVYPLQVSAAFHTAFVKHAQTPFKQAIQKETFKEPAGRVFSNSSAREHTKDPQEIQQILADHILNPVRFKEEIENIYAGGGSIFIEIGPKNVLTNLVKDILKDKPHETICLNARGDSDTQYRQAILEMRVLGFKLGKTDPYRKYRDFTHPKRSQVTVNLNGGLYTSEKTRAAFEQALLEKPAASPKTVPQAAVLQESNPAMTAKPQVKSQDRISTVPKVSPMNYDSNIQTLIERFQEQQNGFLKAHEQFLQNDSASKALLNQITQAQIDILSKLNGSGQDPNAERALSLMEKQADFVNQQQSGSSTAHLEYIKSQRTFSQQYGALLAQLVTSDNTQIELPLIQEESPAEDQQMEIPAPTPTVTISETSAATPQSAAAPVTTYETEQLAQSFLVIVSEKTGYPTDMLELGMDMEADLGIDSIKRVEILGAMQEQYPDLPTISAEDLASLRTLEKIIGAFNRGPQVNAPEASPTTVSVETKDRPFPKGCDAIDKLRVRSFDKPKDRSSSVENGPATEIENSTSSLTELQPAFLTIVSEKTGYPVDMLELSMDMEADLGIDSIKRVEILGAMQEQYPDLPTIEAEDLAILRTLEQIIAAFSSDEKHEAISTPPATSSEAESTAEQPDMDKIERKPVKVVSIPQPDYLEFELPKDAMILITDDGTDRSRLLAESYQNQGLPVGLLHFDNLESPNSKVLPEDIRHFQIKAGDEENIGKTMNAISAENSMLSAFIHIHPANGNSSKDILDLPAGEADILKSVFLMARHLNKALAAAAGTSRPAFLTVSGMDGHFGLDGNLSNDPLAGGLAGLAKTLRLEWPDVFCRALDLHPDIAAKEAARIIDAELHDPDLRLAEVGYTAEGRYTLSLEN